MAVPLLAQLASIIVLSFVLMESERETLQEKHAQTVIAQANNLYNSFMSLGSSVFLYHSSGNLLFKNQVDETFESIPLQIENLRLLVKDSPRYERDRKTIAKLSASGLACLNDLKSVLSTTDKIKGGIASPIIGVTIKLQEFLGNMRKFVRDQEHIELEGKQGQPARAVVVICLLAALFVNTTIVILLAITFNRDTVVRLYQVIHNTQLFKQNKELYPVVTGIDEIALVDAAFHNMASDLAEVSARKQELQAMVTHDLRTPLTNILLGLTMLGEGVAGQLPAKALKTVKASSENCSRLIRLINDLLDIEKLESGKFVINKQEVHISLLFEGVENATEDFAKEKNIELIVSGTETKIMADGDRLVQVLVNLLSNSIKFSEEGKHVWLSCEEKEETVEISVKDEGRGIPAEAIPKLFDRFHQVSKEDGKRGKGTGLGLSITKALVEAHGGNIRVESELGKGTTFIISLPRNSTTAETA